MMKGEMSGVPRIGQGKVTGPEHLDSVGCKREEDEERERGIDAEAKGSAQEAEGCDEREDALNHDADVEEHGSSGAIGAELTGDLMNEAVAGIVEGAEDLDAVVDERDEDGDAEGAEGEGVVGANGAQGNLLEENERECFEVAVHGVLRGSGAVTSSVASEN